MNNVTYDKETGRRLTWWVSTCNHYRFEHVEGVLGSTQQHPDGHYAALALPDKSGLHPCNTTLGPQQPNWGASLLGEIWEQELEQELKNEH